MRVVLNIQSIKVILARRNKDYNWLAERTGLSTSYVYKIMRLEYSPSSDARHKIQRAFNNECWDNLFKILEDEHSEQFYTNTLHTVEHNDKK